MMKPSIIIYTTPTCKVCKAAKSFLHAQGKSYKEIDISKDGKARYQVKKLTGRYRTPVILIGNEVVAGFDQAKLEKLISA